MNKFILWFGFNFLLAVAISAQGYEVRYLHDRADSEDFFMGGGLKTNVYVNDNGKSDFGVWTSPSIGANVFVGKWFSYFFGGRITVEGGKLHPYFQEKTLMVDESYVLGRVDVLFNMSNCSRPCRCIPRPFYSLIPYVGIGGVSVFNAKNRPDHVDNSASFLFGGGLINRFRLSYNCSAILNVGFDMVDASVDGSKNLKKLNGIASASVGVVVDF